MNNRERAPYVRALRFRSLTKYYDLIVGLSTREKTFKTALLRQAKLKSGERILDLACGTGTLAIQCKEMYPEAEVIGVDGDQEILAIAADKADKASLPIKFEEGLSFALPYRDASFDVVTSTLFFHHLTAKDKKRTVSEIARVLTPDGRFHVADWGKPTNIAMRFLFLFVQILDGFKNTSDNINGNLEFILRNQGFPKVKLQRTLNTMFGTMALYECEKDG